MKKENSQVVNDLFGHFGEYNRKNYQGGNSEAERAKIINDLKKISDICERA